MPPAAAFLRECVVRRDCPVVSLWVTLCPFSLRQSHLDTGCIDCHTPTVRTDDIETYYELRGDGPPVVFVHGALADHSAVDQQLAAFSHSYTAIAYEIRGRGRTTSPRNASYSIDLLADDLNDVIDALDLDRSVICGVSTGGMIAQVYAGRYPDQLAGPFSPTPLLPPSSARGTVLSGPCS